MGLLDKIMALFRSKPAKQCCGRCGATCKKQQSVGKNDKLEQVIEKVTSETSKDFIAIRATPCEKQDIFRSKFGGFPYIPSDSQAPTDSDNKTLFHLAQINCEDLPENNLYPKHGLLQFWIGRDDIMGLDIDSPASGNGHRVIYFENIDTGVSLEEVENKYKIRYDDEDYIPLEKDEFSLSFSVEQAPVSVDDYRFNRFFVPAYNVVFDEKIETFLDLEDEFGDRVYDAFPGSDHKIGGYPAFTQVDIREETYESHDVLLLQVDSDDDIMWGDCGVANFFISEEALRNKDFSHILYNWDCG